MGVSGSGKSTIGKGLSKHLDLPFYDADDFHPLENIKKMEKGIPLNDLDRGPWLERLSTEINHWQNEGAVLACSALKETYRKTLQLKAKCNWVYLRVSQEQLIQRLTHRKNHFMPVSLVESQLTTLEAPKYGIHIDAHQPVDQIVKGILEKLK